MEKFKYSPDLVVIHCTDTFVSMEFDVNWISQIHQSKGYETIGYHFLVMPNGEVRYGRDMNYVGAHCFGENRRSIGVAYVGGRDIHGRPRDTRTRSQKVAIASLLYVLAQEVPSLLLVRGHNDFTLQKTCPNFDAKAAYQGLFDDFLRDFEAFGRTKIDNKSSLKF